MFLIVQMSEFYKLHKLYKSLSDNSRLFQFCSEIVSNCFKFFKIVFNCSKLLQYRIVLDHKKLRNQHFLKNSLFLILTSRYILFYIAPFVPICFLFLFLVFTSLPHYTEMGDFSFNPLWELDRYERLTGTSGIRTPCQPKNKAKLTGTLDNSGTLVPLLHEQS